MSACAPGRRLLPLLLLAAATGAAAQQAAPAGASGVIYSCIDDNGRRITADRPITDCNAKAQRILNRDGSLKAVHPPTLTADERAALEAEERKRAEARAAQADAARRDRNLLARYPNEAPHRKAREAALDSVRLATRVTEQRLRDLAAERKPLEAEAEFYAGKPLPPKLRAQFDANEAATEAQNDARLQQQAELDRINRLYDAELARLKLLWAGAVPGSLGPIVPAASASPVAASASGIKASSLR
jgi:hypothetical protein